MHGASDPVPAASPEAPPDGAAGSDAPFSAPAGGCAGDGGASAPRGRLLLVASSGGHLLELLSLRDAWQAHDRTWVTFERPDATELLDGERVVWAHHPTNRNLPNLLRNLGLAWRMLRRERPDAVISTGAGVGVPFLWLGRLLGVPTTYVESLTRVHGLSLSGRLVYPFVDHFYVQWPELADRYPRASFAGQVL